jgi:hypothetical protein
MTLVKYLICIIRIDPYGNNNILIILYFHTYRSNSFLWYPPCSFPNELQRSLEDIETGYLQFDSKHELLITTILA